MTVFAVLGKEYKGDYVAPAKEKLMYIPRNNLR